MANSQSTHPTATQESIFDEPAGSPTLEAYESSYEAAEESSYDGSEDLADDSQESFDAAESAHIVTETTSDADSHEMKAAIQASVPEHEPAQQSLPVEATEAPEATAEAESASEPPSVLTVDDFAALEERIVRAVSLVRSERQARIAAEERASILEAEVQEQIPAIERLQREIDGLRAERDQVRQRVERLLGQLDALEL